MKDIYLEDERFRTSYHSALEKMMLSLEKVGLLHPPYVTLRDNRYILVSGWKRVLSCLRLTLSKIPVFVLDGKDDLQAFSLAFYENLATRELSLMEKAEILARLKRFGEDEERIIRHYLPLLDIPQTLSHLDDYTAFAGFDPEVKKVIIEKNMSFPSLKLLSRFTRQDQKRLLPLIFPLGQNKRREILEDVLEISKRNDIPVQNIILSGEIQAILTDSSLSSLQKADRVRLLLRKRRYPTFSSWTDSFDSVLKTLHWPEDITVLPPPFFEEEHFTVQFTFENLKQFKANLGRLEELSSHKDFLKIFQLK